MLARHLFLATSAASMIEVLVLDHAKAHGLSVPVPGQSGRKDAGKKR